jgi:hypothetical protein
MASTVTGQVGPTVLGDGVQTSPLRQGKSGEQVVTDLHGRYYEQAYRKNLFTAYAAGVAISAPGTALVGLSLWNGSPVVNGVNCVLLKVGGMIIVTSASLTSVNLATGVGQVASPTGQTAITRVSNNFTGAQGPQATALNAGTFTNAPTALIGFLHNTAAIAVTGEDPGFFLDLEGSIILPPQTYCTIVGNAAGAAASANLSLMWEEVAV